MLKITANHNTVVSELNFGTIFIYTAVYFQEKIITKNQPQQIISLLITGWIVYY